MGVRRTTSERERSVANCASIKSHMPQISSRDETYLTLNSVMTIKHSRKRDKAYLKKLFYLRNFLNLLQIYRTYQSWKFRKRSQLKIAWHQREAIAWRHYSATTVRWNSELYHPRIHTTVIFRYYQCQLKITYLIKLPCLFCFDIGPIDKVFHILSGRETLRRNLLIVSAGVDDLFPLICEPIKSPIHQSLLTRFFVF